MVPEPPFACKCSTKPPKMKVPQQIPDSLSSRTSLSSARFAGATPDTGVHCVLASLGKERSGRSLFISTQGERICAMVIWGSPIFEASNLLKMCLTCQGLKFACAKTTLLQHDRRCQGKPLCPQALSCPTSTFSTCYDRQIGLLGQSALIDVYAVESSPFVTHSNRKLCPCNRQPKE